jgi:quercetin dioxygenase-like cupin family protein
MGYVEASVPNICAERHTHFGIENIYVLEGELIMKIDNQPDRPIKTGGVIQILAGVVHVGCVGGNGGKVLTVHVVEKGKPLNTLVK